MKKWFAIYGTGSTGESIKLATVNSQGLAYIVKQTLSAHYKDVKIV